MFFDEGVNAKSVGIGAILISPTGQHYPATARLRFFCTNNTVEYEACIMGMNMAVDLDVKELLIMGDSDLIIRQAQGEWETRDIKLIPYRQHVEDLSKRFKSFEFKYIPRFHNELADALATLALMLSCRGNVHIDPLEIQIRERHGYCNAIEIEPDVQPWYHDIKRLPLEGLPAVFFSGEVLYKRTPDLNLLRCVYAREAEKIMNEVHSGVYGPHMNGYVLAKKILRAELHPMSAPWPFIAWDIDVIRPIEPKASNGHKLILVAIDYFIKWVEAVTFKVVTKKAVVDFVHSNIICCFGIPKTIIIDNVANLSSHLMREADEQFKITHRNCIPYRPKANGSVEAANKNIKKILRKMIQSSRKWHEKLSFALLGYHATVRTSVGATPYLLVYGTKTIIPTEVEIPSLRIIVEAEIKDDEWVETRLEQLTLIDKKRMATVCHGQLYQQRIARSYNKKVRPGKFEVGKLVLRRILPPHEEAKGKFAPNWKGPYIIRKGLVKIKQESHNQLMKELNLHKFKAEIKTLTAKEKSSRGRSTVEAATITLTEELRFKEGVLDADRDC
ncbi:uncharacterized protein [Nicotiana sylvestris]|uniref:uncharacterized protein n=1 Tax=Nicotiana sylvestris TaxID=4096 RepID=UPI00388CAAF7